MLRAPRALKTHATLAPPGAAVKSLGNGALITCSSVKGFDAAIAPIEKNSTSQNATSARAPSGLSFASGFIGSERDARGRGRACPARDAMAANPSTQPSRKKLPNEAVRQDESVLA